MAKSKQNILDKLVDEAEVVQDLNVDVDDTTKMGKLLKNNPIEIPQVGDILEGKVVDVSSSSVLLDLGPLGTGIVLGKEIRDGMSTTGKLKVGDVLNATLIDLENDEGYIELSIREASYEKAWQDLIDKKDQSITAPTKVLDANKGGLMIEMNGITGFLPVSHLSSEHYPRVEDGDKNKILERLKRLVGQELDVRIIDADQETEKLIVSEKEAHSDKERKVISELKKGDVVSGYVSGVVDFGAFVKFYPPSKRESDNEADMLEGLVHISELAWQLIDNPREIVKTGDAVKAKIIDIDDTRISLSIKSLKDDPWHNVEKKYQIGSIVKGKVDKINPFGAFVYLDKDIHGLAHVSEFNEVFKNKKMDEVLKIGETYNWKILSIEPDDHRMGLIYTEDDASADDKDDKKKEKKEDK